MNEPTKHNQFFSAEIDYLDAWEVLAADIETILKINQRKEDSPFVMRFSTGSADDHVNSHCHGGLSIDIFDGNRNKDDSPLVTIRIPWGTGKLIAGFLSSLPSYDPEA